MNNNHVNDDDGDVDEDIDDDGEYDRHYYGDHNMLCVCKRKLTRFRFRFAGYVPLHGCSKPAAHRIV